MSAQQVADQLPSPPDLERISIAASALEIVFGGYPETFDYDGGRIDGTRIASCNRGNGDGYQIYFRDEAAVVRAFEHENSEQENWTQILTALPPAVASAFGDSVRSGEHEGDWATFGAWCRAGETTWALASQSPDDRASSILRVILDGTPQGFAEWLVPAYGLEIDLEVISMFYTFQPLTRSKLEAAGPFDLESAEPDLLRLGYTLESD